MIDVYFTTTSKRKNSTLQPDFTSITPISCALKAPTSEEAPSFLLHWTGGAFPYNYCKWDSHYYWIDGVTFERTDLLTISCSMDVLATYKADILASTQYVAYSSVSGGAWLPDPRIAVQQNAIVDYRSEDVPTLISLGLGNYVLTVLGENGCRSYIFGSLSTISDLLTDVQTENTSLKNQILQNFNPGMTADDIPQALMDFADTMIQTDLLGNAFANAPACIRGCIFVPFAARNASSSEDIMLGNYNTHQSAP